LTENQPEGRALNKKPKEQARRNVEKQEGKKKNPYQETGTG